MNDFASLAGRPHTLTVGGATYQVHPLTFGDLADVQRWVEAQLPDPLAVAEAALDRFPVPIQKHLITQALEIASRPKPRLGTPVADELVRSAAGTAELLRLCIAKGDPSFDEDDARALFERLTIGQLARFFRESGAELILSDPKVETGTSPAPAGPGSTPGSSTAS